MESHHVEMSVGSGVVNGDGVANGLAVNGIARTSREDVQANNKMRTAGVQNGPQTNGIVMGTRGDATEDETSNLLQQAPIELQQMLSTEFYLPMAKLISRSAQTCWNDLTTLVERLATMVVPDQSGDNRLVLDNQSKVNLEKKDLLLNFANDHKAIFIKLLVLLQWSKRGDDVRKTIELNFWLSQRRSAFNNVTWMLGAMLRDLASAQIPNPDLYTAAEVLALGRVPELPDLGYIQPSPLSSRQILRTLKRLNNVLCTKLALEVAIPEKLQNFHVHDGRVTFKVAGDFEFDLSVLDEGLDSKFLMVDLRFLFTPAPSIPNTLHDEICYLVNTAIDRDGLIGAHALLHKLALSYRLSELHRQARELSQGLWLDHLRVEMLRQTLVIQYWLKRSNSKSWLEIGIYGGHSEHLTNHESIPKPQLKVRWMHEGRAIEHHDITIDLISLSVEDILRQAIAQHTTLVFNSLYDRLSLSPLYSSADLEMDLSANTQNPSECRLSIQLSRSEALQVVVEPVSGTILLSPASEQTVRVQNDLNRAKNLTDEFVPRIISLRCSLAERNLLRAMSSSRWQHLEGYKLSHHDIEALFSRSITRASFFRLFSWARQWTLAVTQSAAGDFWWLTQLKRTNHPSGARLTELIDSRPLHVEGPINSTYMEHLAQYATGVLTLQCNAQHLSRDKHFYHLPPMPRFSRECKLPSLRFSRRLTTNTAHHNTEQSTTCISDLVELSYHGFKPSSDVIITVARAMFSTNSAVLRELATSQLDDSVAISSDSRQVLLQCVSQPGISVIPDILSKLKHLDSMVACAATVKRSTSHHLRSLSLSAITISYNSQPSRDLRMVIDIGKSSDVVTAKFLPVKTNPHHYLEAHITRLLSKGAQGLSQSLGMVLSLLKMTEPLLVFLQKIQSASDDSVGGDTIDSRGKVIRVHVLPRQAAIYGIQYFARSANFLRDTDDSGTPKKLLARLEILPMSRGKRLMWMVRPAIEEFNSYNRPSFTANALRMKLKEEIFSKPRAQDWLSLDGGAVCPYDRPEPLLRELHAKITEWAEEAIRIGLEVDSAPPAVKKEEAPKQDKPKPAKPVSIQNKTNSQNRQNGTQTQSQPPKTNPQLQHNNSNGMKPQPSKKQQEVINID